MKDYRTILTSDSVVQVPVIEGGASIFDLLPNCTFRVPIYQRAFAWGTPPHEVNGNELICLMEDIHDAVPSDETESGEYFIGSIVVKAKEDDESGRLVCKVVDGQQRLTALFIILNCLGVQISSSNPLDYAQRNRSACAIRRMKDVVKFAKGFVEKTNVEDSGVYRDDGGEWFYKDELTKPEPLENSICNGVVAVTDKLMNGDEKDREKYREQLLRGLANVRLFIVNVPKGTDLNRYFEVMNTRGEQLNPQDVVKAMLMRHLADAGKCSLFAQIWNACSDMDGYIQMHFQPELRKEIFGADWTAFPNIKKVALGTAVGAERLSICDSLLRGNAAADSSDGTNQGDGSAEKAERAGDPVRFRGIIPFPQFLLHVLKVFCHENKPGDLDRSEIDAAKMIRRFEELLDESGSKEMKADVSWRFIQCLLGCRFLFDKYIVKRDYERDSNDGEWSVKELKQSDGTAYYVNTDGDGEDGENGRFRESALMLQSCMRVTYTEFKGMHWITKLLDWLYANAQDGSVKWSTFAGESEKIAGEAAKAGVDSLKKKNCRMGTLTPHIIFNYLDYLLWRDAHEANACGMKESDETHPFAFTYRNSVEHWYPQHPENLDPWLDLDAEARRAVDQFGNLCIVQPSENSRFSNLRPSAKRQQYPETVEGGSLKLRLMARLTPIDKDNEVRWKEMCEEHGKAMLNLLQAAFDRVFGTNPQ